MPHQQMQNRDSGARRAPLVVVQVDVVGNHRGPVRLLGPLGLVRCR